MRSFRRYTVALPILLFVGVSLAQPSSDASYDLETYWRLVRSPLAPVLYERVRSHDSIGAQLLEAITAPVGEELEGSDNASLVPGAAVCIHFAGAGANPRWDGGGGLVSTAIGPEADPRLAFADAILQVHEWGDHVRHWAPQSGGGARIVIVDEFDLETLLGSGDASGSVDLRDAWTVLVDDVKAARGDLSALAQSVPHGHFVLYHMLRTLEPAEAAPSIRVVDDGHGGARIDIGNATHAVTIHIVHVTFEDVASIRRGLVTAADIARDTSGQPGIVNLSWALVDCAIEAAYRVSFDGSDTDEHRQDFARYVASLVAKLDDDALSDLLTEICFVDEDLFFDLTGVQECSSVAEPRDLVAIVAIGALAASDVRARGEVEFDRLDVPHSSDAPPMFVAAAGNQGLSFPMPPAAWDGVLGVASCQPPAPQDAGRFGMSFFSNVPAFAADGDVAGAIAVGAFFALRTDDTVGGAWIGYYGTSFAAPAVAAFIATRGWNSVSALPWSALGFALEPCGAIAWPLSDAP